MFDTRGQSAGSRLLYANGVLNDYTSETSFTQKFFYTMSQKSQNNTIQRTPEVGLYPNYISGLIHADGSFFISVSRNAKSKFGVRFVPKFSLTLHSSSIDTLKKVRAYFGGSGYIAVNKTKDSGELVISTLTNLETFVIPHFFKYPVFGRKQQAFHGFVNVVLDLKRKNHHVYQNWLTLLKVSLALNPTPTSDQRREKWEQRLLLKRQDLFVNVDEHPYFQVGAQAFERTSKPFLLTDQFIVGLIDGDGSFNVSFHAHAKLRFEMQITGDRSQETLFRQIQQRLGCGFLRVEHRKNVLKYQVIGGKQIAKYVLPFMAGDGLELHTEKKKHYDIFKHVLEVYVLGKDFIKTRDFLDIVELSYNMNFEGKRRKLTKEEYLAKYTADIAGLDTQRVR